ncbi:MAG: sigma factor, partial [Pseudonocardiaceae bacterium]
MDDLTPLALAARDGDRLALTAFIRAAQPDVWRYCAHFGSTADADDLTQEVFIRAIGALSSFRGQSSVQTWLLT